MTSRNRFVATALTLLMLVPAVLVLAPPAIAQDNVPTKPGVTFEPIPNLRQFLYLRYPNVSDEVRSPNCAAPEQFAIALRPAGNPAGVDPRASCTWRATVAGTEGDVVSFRTPLELTPSRRVGFTGNDSFYYHHIGGVREGIRVDVEVRSGDQTIATGSFNGTSDSEYHTRLNLAGPTAQTGRVEMLDNQTVSVIVRATVTAAGATGEVPGVTVPTWQLNDRESYLEIRAENAVRAAMWITDEKDVLRNVFAPIANESQLPADLDRRVVAHFAVQSAFGYDDARFGGAPQFTVLYDNRPREIGSNGETLIEGQLNLSSSITSLGVAVWSFPTDKLNYRGFPSGEYTIHVEKNHHGGAPINRAVDRTFAITAQSVRLEPYSDPRVPGLVETQAHSVQAGSSTTYLLMVNNTGSVNDTFTINLTAPNAAGGWGATIGGPDVQSRRVFVPAGESRVFTVTVNAPLGVTGQVIHLVNVTSMVDPGARSRDLTLVTTVSNEVIREVGVVFLARDLAVEPGVETHYPVYVWNRGTRVANVSLEIQETPVAGWTADLARGNANVDRLVLSGIPPGDIAQATLKITGPLTQSVTQHAVTLNATSQDFAGISGERTLSFVLRTLAGVRVDVFGSIGAKQHVVEVVEDVRVMNPVTNEPAGLDPRCDDATPDEQQLDCDDDGLDGIWFRVWVTNTGKVTDTFQLSGDSFDEAFVRSDCRSEVFVPDATAETPMSGDFGFYHRSPGGIAGKRDAIPSLPPGKTAEVYVYLPVNRFAELCIDSDRGEDFFDFVVQAKGQTHGAIGRAGASAVARNNGGHPGVHLEGIVRETGYSQGAPYVDIQNATKRTIVGLAEPGKNTTYYVRMTNAASWSEFNDADGKRVASDLHVTLLGVDREGGWNVSIRPVLEPSDMTLERNPYDDEAYLRNTNNYDSNRREGWFDRELEVVVQAPTAANGTAVAGTRHEFSLVARSTNGTVDQSTLEIATIIADLANVSVRSDQPRIFAHPGEPGGMLLYISNNGSSEARVTLRASMNPDNTPNAAAWQLNPNAQTFPLAAFKNRTVALLVTPPPGAAQGTTGEVNVTVEYPRSSLFPNLTTNVTLRLAVEVVAPGTLQITAPTTDATIGPGGTANYTMTLRNSGSLQVPFRMVATPIPNWTVTVSPEQGTLAPGETRTVVLVLVAPDDVVNDTRFASIVRVEEVGATNNFDTAAFTVNILGGKALPRLSVPNLVKRVDRSGVQHFEVQVQNVGSAAGRLPLEVRAQDPSWQVGIIDSRGNNISGVQLGVNELATINVTVRAPFHVPERTVVPVEIIAYSPDITQAAKATLSAEIHDYGVQLTLMPATKDGLPGIPTEFVAKVRNTGNDNDTLNLSVNLIDYPEWTVQLSSEEVRLEPNQEAEIRATMRGPTDPLPTPRAYSFPFWVGTRGGQAVNITKNMTAAAVLTIPNYRAYDVDRDGQLEIAVDLDKRAGNGFEEFREIFTDGLNTQVVAKPAFEGRTTLFLDVPRERPYDGVADVWFNPETVHAFEIVHAPDVNDDGTPDYLLDTDRDAKLDKAFDSATERFWDVFEIKVFGDDRIQYLVDITGDGRPDRFFDPETSKVTRTQKADDLGAEFVGIDVDDDDRVDYYYNTRTEETSGAEVQNLGGFALQYWYFFVAFAVLVLLSVMLIARRRRQG